MRKGHSTPKEDILFTGFASHASRPNEQVDEFLESELDLDLNSNGEYQVPAICLDVLKG
jgi:hypothetical protein